MPGYRVTGAPRSRTGGSTSDAGAKPEVCRPLWDARVGASATSAAWASVAIVPSDAALQTERLTFASYGPEQADAYFASLEKALDSCASLSFLSSYGDRATAEIEQLANPIVAGYVSVSFRMHWSFDRDGFKSDTYSLITTLRTGDATVTVMADSSVGSQLSASQKSAFMPQPDPDMLKSQADKLREAQTRAAE